MSTFENNQLLTLAVRDLSERKAEEQKQTELLTELGQANEQLRQYGQIVSHEKLFNCSMFLKT